MSKVEMHAVRRTKKEVEKTRWSFEDKISIVPLAKIECNYLIPSITASILTFNLTILS